MMTLDSLVQECSILRKVCPGTLIFPTKDFGLLRLDNTKLKYYRYFMPFMKSVSLCSLAFLLASCLGFKNFQVQENARPAELARLAMHSELTLLEINGTRILYWRRLQMPPGEYELKVSFSREVGGHDLFLVKTRKVTLNAGDTHYVCPVLTYNRVNDLQDFDFDIVVDNEFEPMLLPADEIDYVPPKCRRKDDIYR